MYVCSLDFPRKLGAYKKAENQPKTLAGTDRMMEKVGVRAAQLFGRLITSLRQCLFKVMSVGPIPAHVAFIMDGNRRYAKKHNAAVGSGHRAGYSSLTNLLVYCYELGVKYVTVYAFSIDNFKRKPDEVQYLMDLMLEKIEGMLEQQSIANRYGIRLHFIGNLKLLSEPVRLAAEKAMSATAHNDKAVLLVCVAYTSCDEIVHAVGEACKEKRNESRALSRSKPTNGAIEDISDDLDDITEAKTCNGSMEKPTKLPEIKLSDVEKHMYMAVAPDPDIVIRSSGETRLSNFLLWQTAYCPLYSPSALWPELGLRHLVWSVLNYQRSYSYLERKKKNL